MSVPRAAGQDSSSRRTWTSKVAAGWRTLLCWKLKVSLMCFSIAADRFVGLEKKKTLLSVVQSPQLSPWHPRTEKS